MNENTPSAPPSQSSAERYALQLLRLLEPSAQPGHLTARQQQLAREEVLRLLQQLDDDAVASTLQKLYQLASQQSRPRGVGGRLPLRVFRANWRP
jgi:hypothetical protein